ncbi:MAG: host attachment protein [Proteobacteria bacterium]|nr:host attachment protein [Pseudomonadota bacterium]
MLIPNDTLVLIGDGRKALFLRNRGAAANPDLMTEKVMEQDNPATRDQGSDRPGRHPGTDGASKSALEETDWHQLAEDRFAMDVAEALYRKSHDQNFQHLVIVAPPRALGSMRGALRKEVEQKITAEIPKDLTGQPLPEIARMLQMEQAK